jgi:ligand-binding SRPBCC domain-containing protein
MAVHFLKEPGAFVLESAVHIARPIGEVFEFFSDARNLDQLTPAWLKFNVLTPDPIEMRPGTLIDYQLRIRGLPIRWQSEITAWDPPRGFVDEQRRGPYKLWHHEHIFESEGDGTRVIDRVRYDVLGGALVERLFVRRDLERIFNYRTERLLEIFPPVAQARGARR